MIPRQHRSLILVFAALVSFAGFGAVILSSCAVLGGKESLSPVLEDHDRVPGDSVESAESPSPKPADEPSPKATEEPADFAGTGESGGKGEEAAKDAETRGIVAAVEEKGDGGDYMYEVAPEAAMPDRSGGGSASSGTARSTTPSVSGLKAGFADDNKQYNYFVDFLARYAPQVDHFRIPIEERIVFKVRDSRGRSVPNASLEITGPAGQRLDTGLSYADGSFMFFPAEHGSASRYSVRVTYNQQTRELAFDRQGRRELEIAMPGPRGELANVPLDLLFILDTTGSMGEEIERLKTTIEIINLNLSSLSSRPRVRFGMVLYKDRGDEYDTRVVPFTENLGRFQQALEAVSADGGGDTPEDLQSALEKSMTLDWNRGGVRLAFIVTDAPPHLDYGQEYTYVQAAREAKTKGIKVFSVGTGGLDLMGEVVLRQISQYSSGKYIFLTYGETGESEGGAPGSVSHHTGANYQTDKLEAIIIRFAKEELAHLTDQPLDEEQEYFEANKIPEEEREETLGKLFAMAVSQLVDYSTVRLPSGTPAAVLPVSPARDPLALNAEYFTEQLVLSFGQSGAARDSFRLVERQDLQKILEELELQLSDLADSSGDSSGATRVGSLLGAEVLIAGKLYEKQDGFELFLKLLRVETGEVLSITKAVIDRRLGLEA